MSTQTLNERPAPNLSQRELVLRYEEKAQEVEALQSRYRDACDRIEELEQEVDAMVRENQMRKSIEATLRERLTQLSGEINTKEQRLERLSSDLTLVSDLRRQDELEIRRLQQRVAQAELKAQTVENRSRDEVARLRDQLEQGNFKVTEAQKQAWSALEKQSQRLRSYSLMLHQRRLEILNYSKQSAELLQSAHQMHPLQDYLKVTEFEISRIEKEARATADSSPQRPRLEQALKQMIQQRDFLRSVIDASRDQLELNAAKIAQMGSEQAVGEIPPAPPNVESPFQQETRS